MSYSAKEEWSKAITGTTAAFPAQGLIRMFRGDYPNLSKMPRNCSLLDIGCGDGRNAKFLQDEGYEVIGIEISSEIVNHLSQNFADVEFKVGQSDNLPIASGTVDIAVAWNSIYYMGMGELNILKNLQECKRVLSNAESVLILSIPMPTSFIFANSEVVTENEGVEYRVIRNDPYGARNGEIMACFPDVENLRSMITLSGFERIEIGEERGDWFGRRYDWWVIACRPGNR